VDYEGKKPKRPHLAWLFGATLVVALVAPAAAQVRSISPPPPELDTTWRRLQRTGLAGTWALSCGDPASPGNWIVTFFSQDGTSARVRTDRGSSDGAAWSAVESVNPISVTLIGVALRYDDPRWGPLNGQGNRMIYEIANRRLQTREAVNDRGEVWIKDSLVVATGRAAQILERCGD
jgi:hypothetical protein